MRRTLPVAIPEAGGGGWRIGGDFVKVPYEKCLGKVLQNHAAAATHRHPPLVQAADGDERPRENTVIGGKASLNRSPLITRCPWVPLAASKPRSDRFRRHRRLREGPANFTRRPKSVIVIRAACWGTSVGSAHAAFFEPLPHATSSAAVRSCMESSRSAVDGPCPEERGAACTVA
jgi:hypothetical protein